MNGSVQILNKKFKLQYSDTVKSLQFPNLVRQQNDVKRNGWVCLEQQIWDTTIKK